MDNKMPPTMPDDRLVQIDAEEVELDGILNVPEGARGAVLFAHGSGSSRNSPRNRYVARVLAEHRLATLLIDLLTAGEEEVDSRTAELRFNIGFLAKRLVRATDWLYQQPETSRLKLGYFGASTGAAAALEAAVERPRLVAAIVSRGGRPDLAGSALSQVVAPTLLIVGGRDQLVAAINQRALAELQVEKELQIVPGATHLFEEPGALEKVASLAAGWFTRHLGTV
jgi:putative phosphoribosyl transferase